MCGRYTLTDVDLALLAETFDLGGSGQDGPVSNLDQLAPRYNIAPSQTVAAIVHDRAANHNRLDFMQWGLIPHWAKDRSWQNKLINARGESIHEKASFRDAFKHKRCLIAADGFYEWQAQSDGTKRPVYIMLADHALFGLAGLWSQWTDPDSGEVLTTCTIVTTTANRLMEPIHNRMPVILPREDYARWLNPTITAPEALQALIRPYPDHLMTWYPVSPRVNRPSNDDPGLIQRAG